jgi:hypothetical protein
MGVKLSTHPCLVPKVKADWSYTSTRRLIVGCSASPLRVTYVLYVFENIDNA